MYVLLYLVQPNYDVDVGYTDVTVFIKQIKNRNKNTFPLHY